ncbi:hypothetical protein HO133_003920 [Letharia lupina]|uniref:Fungal N-terminal domain-containing protein n=1 Tax=Letharia lupina TaxID=560253 RepID=A0A8H6F9D3_9LECA|nr:uncharacterized protein HO133_003920 [Letharia lupina]KAF6219454.1 hypothetical protein HO133_003920 [Letharia lupina]
MDPFSLAASIITVIGATKTGINGIKVLRGASDGLEDLLADISQFEAVLEAIQNLPGARDNADSELKRLLESGSKKVVELNSLVQYRLTKAGESSKVDRLQWIRSGHDVERLRGQLRDIIANLVALVGVNTCTTVQHVSQVTSQVLFEHRQLSSQMVALATQVTQLLEGSPSTRAALAASMGDVRHLAIESSPRPKVPVTEKTTTLDLSQPKSHLDPQNDLYIRRVRTISLCNKYCVCKCHLRRQLGPSGIFSKLIGSGYIETAGPSIFGTQCDIELCRARAAPRVSVQYRLPQWLISRMIFMWFTSSPPYAPEFVLRVPRVIDFWSTNAFQAVGTGDLGLLKSAITNGDCTPYDIDTSGRTLLACAADDRKWKIVEYLLAYGDSSNRSSITPLAESMIWEKLVLDPLSFGNGLRLTYIWPRPFRVDILMFPMIEWESCIEGQGFTVLHQMVCGLSRRSLDVELQSSNINELDKDNRSALWYSVAHGKREYVHLLLERGADPNVGDLPILIASGVRSDYEITKALLDAGATLNFSNDKEFWKLWPRWPVCWEKREDEDDTIAIDNLLVRHGIDINHHAEWRGVEDVTILMLLCDFSPRFISPLRIQQMIDLGADLEMVDENGESAIMYALHDMSPKSFEVLARAGARLDVRNVAGNSILHLVIKCTYSISFFYELYQVLRNADLTKLDLHARNADGHTAFDLLKMRNGLKWDGYCESKGIPDWRRPRNDSDEMDFIRASEVLFHDIQDLQDVPEEDRYPPLGEHLSGDDEEEVVPGAWPV